MSANNLVLEVLSGPLDGVAITLEAEAEWSHTGETPLSFPWDAELGQPQARFTVEEGHWHLEGLNAPHGTYRVNREERLTGKKVQLEGGDILKASQTWLLVRQA
jgi:hypothetical protein